MSKFSPEEIKKLEQILNPKEEIEKIKKRDFNHIYRSQKEVDEYIKQVEESQNNEYYNFSNVLFLCKISFNYKFKKYALFSLACFIDSASFSNAIFTYEANFQNTTFYKNALFNETIFKNEVRFTRSSFAQTANFQAIEIKGKAYFDESVFNQELLLHDSILEDYTNFEGVEFKDKVKGWNITCLGNISFKWANFRNKVNFSELKVNNGSANFHGTNFEENAYFYNSKINTLILSKSVIDKGVYFLDANIKNANRETWCIIKHEFIKQDNRIEALSYHALEMAAYDLELGKLINCKGLECIYKFIQFIVCSSISFLSRIFSKKQRVIISTPTWDKITLMLNKHSNDFGINPGKGISFILIVGIFYFMLYMPILLEMKLDLSWAGFVEWCKMINSNLMYFPLFINPTHSFDFMKEISKNYLGWALVIDIIGRISIGFGIYQTIQAFRKYGRF